MNPPDAETGPCTWRWGWAWLAKLVVPTFVFAALFASWTIASREVESLYKVTADTEQLTFVAEGRMDPIHLVTAVVDDDGGTRPAFTGSLRFTDSVSVVLTKITTDSALTLTIQPRGDREPGTLTFPDGHTEALKGDAMVSIPLARSRSGGEQRTSLRFSAHDVVVGVVSRSGAPAFTQPVLRSGRVTLLGLSSGNAPFESGTFELGPYEWITGSGGAAQSRWWGALTTSADAAITATFATETSRITLHRGAEEYPLVITLFDRIRSQPNMAFVCFVAAMAAQISLAILTNTIQNALSPPSTEREREWNHHAPCRSPRP
jgi:hypothetical protein